MSYIEVWCYFIKTSCVDLGMNEKYHKALFTRSFKQKRKFSRVGKRTL